MTRDEIAAMLAGVGLPTAYDHFTEAEAPGAPPFICFLYPNRNDFAADDNVYAKITALRVELYTDDPTPALEESLEAALEAKGLIYDKEGPGYIDGEKMYMTAYDTDVLLEPTPAPTPEPGKTIDTEEDNPNG